jgi:hypothetical protein
LEKEFKLFLTSLIICLFTHIVPATICLFQFSIQQEPSTADSRLKITPVLFV